MEKREFFAIIIIRQYDERCGLTIVNNVSSASFFPPPPTSLNVIAIETREEIRDRDRKREEWRKMQTNTKPQSDDDDTNGRSERKRKIYVNTPRKIYYV